MYNMDKKLIAGVVVLYNPAISIIDNIRSYLHQIDRLFVIDNSDKKNDFIVKELDGNVTYLFNNKNIGIAKALNVGAEIAIQKGYKYLLTMDQDSIAPSGMVDSLLKIFNKSDDVGIVSPLHSNKYSTHLRFTEPLEKIDVVMTSGNLLSLKAYQSVGPFSDDYFIDYVDIEYCLRLKLNGYLVYRLNKIVLEHSEADLSEKKIFNKKFYPHNHKPFRLYYKTRNLLFLRKSYKKKFPDLLKVEYDSYIRTVVKIVLFEKQKILKLKMILLGIKDYFLGRTGRKL